jgi:hypothetical protein
VRNVAEVASDKLQQQQRRAISAVEIVGDERQHGSRRRGVLEEARHVVEGPEPGVGGCILRNGRDFRWTLAQLRDNRCDLRRAGAEKAQLLQVDRFRARQCSRAIEAEGKGYLLRDGAQSYASHSAGETASLRQKFSWLLGLVCHCFAELQRCHPTGPLAPARIDILTGITGVGVEEAWPNRLTVAVDDQAVAVLGIAELIRNKMATGRPKDQADLKGGCFFGRRPHGGNRCTDRESPPIQAVPVTQDARTGYNVVAGAPFGKLGSAILRERDKRVRSFVDRRRYERAKIAERYRQTPAAAYGRGDFLEAS